MCNRIVVLVFVILLAIGEAQAKDTGFGVSVGIGASRVEDNDGDEGSFSGDGTGLSIDLEYRFARNFAAGLGYLRFGETTDTVNGIETEIDAAAVGFFARAIFPLNDTVELYGRLGNSLYSATVVPDLGLALDDGWIAGVGLDIGRDENYSFRLEGQFLNGGADERATLLSAGIAFRF